MLIPNIKKLSGGMTGPAWTNGNDNSTLSYLKQKTLGLAISFRLEYILLPLIWEFASLCAKPYPISQGEPVIFKIILNSQ